MVYCDLIVDGERLYLKETQFERENYLLGEYVADFELTRRKDFTIFQDSSFKVYTRCNGEWGAAVFFQEIETKDVYEVASSCVTAINKLGEAYYITSNHVYGLGAVVQKINDPRRLTKTKLVLDKGRGSKHPEGSEIAFKKYSWPSPTGIHTSFVADSRLLHLYSDSTGTNIGELANGSLQSVYTFDQNFSARLCQQYLDGKQLLICWFPDTLKQAMLLIENAQFTFYYLR